MGHNCHRLPLAIAALAAVGCLVSGPAGAQPLVATAGSIAEPCLVRAQLSPCSRGVLYLVNGSTLEIASTVTLWQGVPDRTLSKLVVDPAGRFIYAAQRSASLSSPLSQWIDVIDLTTMTRVTTYGVTGDLAAVSPDGLRLYLLTATAVLVIDSATGAVVASMPADFPLAVAASQTGARIYVAPGTSAAPSIAVFDARTYVQLDVIALPEVVRELGLTSDGLHLYALAPYSRVFDIDPVSNTIAGVITNFGRASAPQRLSLAGGRAYVSVTYFTPGVVPGEGIAVIDIATRALITQVPVVDPFFVAASPDGSRVWAQTFSEPRIITIDAATNTRLGRTEIPGGVLDLVAIPSDRRSGLVVDQPAAGAALQQPFVMSGWAVDSVGKVAGPGVSTVHVWAFPEGGGAPVFVGADYGRSRPDVGSLFGASFVDSGYQVTVRGLPPGTYQLTAFAFSVWTGQFSIVRSVPVTIRPGPRLVVDTPHDDSVVSSRFTIAGWAIDGDAATGTGIDAIHVWAYPAVGGAPVFAGVATLGDARPDVAAYFGAQFARSGYRLEVTTLAPGAYTLIAYGHSSVTGTFSVEQHVRVTIPPRQPLMWVDTPAANAIVGGTFTVAGWAVEFQAAAGTGVDLIHIWATSPSGVATFLGLATYGGSRPDVAAWIGAQYGASGFSLTASLPAGVYTLSVYARSTETGTFRQWQAVPITVR